MAGGGWGAVGAVPSDFQELRSGVPFSFPTSNLCSDLVPLHPPAFGVITGYPWTLEGLSGLFIIKSLVSICLFFKDLFI